MRRPTAAGRPATHGKTPDGSRKISIMSQQPSITILCAAAWLTTLLTAACGQKKAVEESYPDKLPAVISDPTGYRPLSGEEAYVILDKGTERAFTGAYFNLKDQGTYICRQCNNPLFRSQDKFDSGTGWPSFDNTIGDGVRELPDADGSRVEIVCSNCDGHLGHVFRGEGFTERQTRHCANSASLRFIPAPVVQRDGVLPIGAYLRDKDYGAYAAATLAGGCFWCTEAAFERIEGVVDVISGYCGGPERYPSYEAVGGGQTGHAEAIRIYYDSTVIDFPTLLDVFFVAHDPTQLNRQGPDVGPQYRSAIFYHDERQAEQARTAIEALDAAGKWADPVVTRLSPLTEFWVAEAYHQDYYPQHPENPYVQRITRPKVEKVEKAFADRLKEAYRR
jgi:peptide methionine sulfoxide reductase msrA/msrB